MMKLNPYPIPGEDSCGFSVRGLIVLVLLIGGCLGWIARSASIQREAVAAIRRASGSVVYAYPRDGVSMCGLAPQPRHPGPRIPRWLEKAVGTDYFLHPFEVDFQGTGSDNVLFHVAQLESLERLWIEDTNVTDAGLAHLKGLTGLEGGSGALQGSRFLTAKARRARRRDELKKDARGDRADC